MKCAAYTAATGNGYPPFANATLDGDEVILRVRDNPTIIADGLRCGHVSEMRMPRAEFEKFIADAQEMLK